MCRTCRNCPRAGISQPSSARTNFCGWSAISSALSGPDREGVTMTGPAKLMTLVRATAPEGWAAAQEAALGSGLPGARRIVLNRVRPVEVRATDLPVEQWDAVMEGWFDTRAD